jgi:ActR/RegA family two-component response regulator
MTDIKVLVADDDTAWGTKVANFLQKQAKYTILQANTFAETREALEQNIADVAVIDIRLVDNNNPKDISGLQLAKKYAPNMPKIIVTDHPTFANVRDALNRIDGLPAGIHFIAKREGLTPILLAIDAVTGPRLKAYQEGDLIFGPVIKVGDIKSDVFVMMPFDPKFDPVRDMLTADLPGVVGITIKRGDDFFTGNGIMHEVWSAINEAKCVIADCTKANANVFYELGVAHSLGKPVILITQRIKNIPFDIRHMRLREYKNTPAGLKKLMDELEEDLKRLLKK